MDDIEVFDANCSVGAPMNEVVRHAETVADLCEGIDRNGFGMALVFYFNASAI